MTIALTPLPYADTALEPHISAETLQTHHGKHHKTYVDKLNAAIEGTDLAGKSLEEIIHHAEGSGNKGMFNNAAQAWNHGFYWNSLTPDATAPGGDLADAIDRDFGSLDELKKKLKETAINHFASGWAWLVSRDGTLSVTDTHDAGTELVAGIKPLLVVDVWEHAYYIDRKNVRPDYVNATVDHLLNWDFAAENFAREGTWTYPG
jgi:superoxide dismutase, Fe-Mn family